jgi:alcohol dehydrogenase class IV
MSGEMERAFAMMKEFKGDAYAFGGGTLDSAPGRFAAEFGKRALLVGRIDSGWFHPILERILRSLENAGVERVDVVRSAAPNAPLEDVYRIYGRIGETKPDVLVVADGGSGIDAVKAAAVLAALGDTRPDLDPFFGVGRVTEALRGTGRSLAPVVAVMMAASSGAHLTKYSNVTDPVKGQKKLIVDEAVVPPRAVFDYDVTVTQPMSLTLDGGLDGIAHCLEVYFGAAPAARERARRVAELGIELIVSGLALVKQDPASKEGRTRLGLGTDLGGYAIMIGGTSGAHLSSFSLVDVLSHGRACALMNPYYTVFFAPAIQEQLRVVGRVYAKHGYLEGDVNRLSGRELGLAVAGAMVGFSEFLGFPTRLSEVKGVGREHIDRCLAAAKDPQLDMKLRNMPVPLHAGLVDRYMGPVLEAAWTGDFGVIRNM